MKAKCIFDEEKECPVIPFLLRHTQPIEQEPPIIGDPITTALSKITQNYASSARITMLSHFCNICLQYRLIKMIEKVLL